MVPRSVLPFTGSQNSAGAKKELMNSLRTCGLAILMCAACASHHLPPEELLEANLEAMQEAVTARVPDTQRAARLNTSITRLESQRSRLEKEVLSALERHDTPTEELQSIEREADEINASATQKMLDVRFVMRQQLSDEHWRAIFSAPAAR